MKQLIAGSILSIMVAGIGWVGASVINYSSRISVLEAKELTHKDLLKEVRDDVKSILKRLP